MITNTKALADKVETNLVHFHHWTDVLPLSVQLGNSTLHLLRGNDPRTNSEANSRDDFILPVHKTTKVSLEDLDMLFQSLDNKSGCKPAKLLMAIIDFDGSVLYYNVYEGLKKPQS